MCADVHIYIIYIYIYILYIYIHHMVGYVGARGEEDTTANSSDPLEVRDKERVLEDWPWHQSRHA